MNAIGSISTGDILLASIHAILFFSSPSVPDLSHRPLAFEPFRNLTKRVLVPLGRTQVVSAMA
jgi:hypothetical protein